MYSWNHFKKKAFKNWNPKSYRWKDSSEVINLIIYCPEYIHIWWDPTKMDLHDCFYYLKNHCFEYKHIWYKDYLIWKLSQ